jgi:hypothetical protein
MRPRLPLLLALAALGLALGLSACGGGGGEETHAVSAGDDTVAIEGNLPDDPFEQIRFVLGKFPYKPWYRDCIVREVEKELSADELEELAQLPEEQARRVGLRYALGASPKCERKGREPIEADADKVEIQLLRIGYATTLEALAKREGLSPGQAGCLSSTISKFPDQKVVHLGNAEEAEREKILVDVIEGCTS